MKEMPMLNYAKYIKTFPDCPKSVPFYLLDENQAQKNHSQTLSRLAERGGLVPSEMIAIINKRDWYSCDEGEAIRVINHHLSKARP